MLCGAPTRSASRSALTSDLGNPATAASRASVVGRFCSSRRRVSRLKAQSRPLPSIKHPPMLQNRIPIRHPRDVIRDRPGAAGGALGGLGLQRQVAMFGGHETYVFEERPEERFQDAAGLGCHAEQLVVLLDALAEELHQSGMLLGGGGVEARE